jgi:hypothetical protein
MKLLYQIFSRELAVTFLGEHVPIEDPKQFELSTLETMLKSIDEPQPAGIWCAIFGAVGALLFMVVYFLHSESMISPYWLYLACALGGVCLGGAAIINRLSNQSMLLHQYIDKEAINKRIAELKM